jgi:hypothetical protein
MTPQPAARDNRPTTVAPARPGGIARCFAAPLHQLQEANRDKHQSQRDKKLANIAFQ